MHSLVHYRATAVLPIASHAYYSSAYGAVEIYRVGRDVCIEL